MKKLICLYFLLQGLHAIAQDTTSLNPVSVTANRFNQKISETGRSITILQKTQIENLPFTSIDELLKYIGGVEVQQRGPSGAQADIVIRGGTFQQVLILLDGVKLNDPITGHFSAYIPLVPSQIERIEVLKGPAAAMYGTEAVGGVINIISKIFYANTNTSQKQSYGSIAAGEYGFIRAEGQYAKKIKNTHFSVGALSNNSKGQLLRGQNRGYFYNQTFSAMLATKLSTNWQLYLHSSYDNRDFAAQNFYTTFLSDTATEVVKTFWNHVKLQRKKLKTTDEIDVTFKNTSDYFLFNPAAVANENKSNLLTMQYVHSQILSKQWQFNAGVLGELKSIKSNDRGNHDNYNGAVFSSLLYKYKSLSLSPAVRVVHDNNYGTQVLPQTNVAVQIQKLNLRATAGRAVRSADFTERYNNFNKAFVSSGTLGNPDLKAETSWSYEGGADIILKQFKIGATYFYRSQKQVIDFVRTPYAQLPRKSNLSPSGTYALAKNISAVQTKGLEIELAYQQSFSERFTLYATATATFLNSKSSEPVPSFYILSHAKTLLQQNIILTLKQLDISISSIYKERLAQEATALKAKVSKDYWVVNTKVNYRYKNANAFVAIANIGNVRYSDLLGSQLPGSWFSGGLGLRF